MNYAVAKLAAQLSRRIAITNREEADLRELIREQFCFEMLWLIKRVVALSAVCHLLRLYVPCVHNSVAIVMHLSDAPHCVCIKDLYGLCASLVRRSLYKVI